MKQISIIAATFYGNRGAEGMLTTTIAELRANTENKNELIFNVFSYYPNKDASLVKDINVNIYSSTPAYLVLVLLPSAIVYQLFAIPGIKSLRSILPNSVKALAQSEVLICLAGVSFVAGRTKFLPFNIATILPALLLKVPVIKFAQALGPFNGLINKVLAKIFLSRCARIFTRGEKTQAHMTKLLPNNNNYERADDVAFLFQPHYSLSTPATGLEEKLLQQQMLSKTKATQGLVIGVCPSIVVALQAEKNGWDYPQSMANLINDLVSKNYSVVLYPNATRGDDMELKHNNDLPLLDEIEAKIKPEYSEKVIKFSGSLNAAQIHKVINTCDIHLVSRFHAMVAALSSSIPVLVIGWSHKYLEVMERFNQQDMVIDYKQGSQKQVMLTLEKLVLERELRKISINKALNNVKVLSKKQINYVVNILRTNGE